MRTRFRYCVSSETVATDISEIKVVGAGGLELLHLYLHETGLTTDPSHGLINNPVDILPDWNEYPLSTSAFISLFKDALTSTKAAGMSMDFALGCQAGQGVPSEPSTTGLAVELLMGNATVSADTDNSVSVPPAQKTGAYIQNGFTFMLPQEPFGTANLTSVLAYELLNESMMDTGMGYSIPTDILNESSYIDLTSLELGDLKLSWQPPEGEKTWKIFSFWEAYTNQRSRSGGSNATDFIGNGSWVVDHFSKTGASRTTQFWDDHTLADTEVPDLSASVGKYAWEDSLSDVPLIDAPEGDLLQKIKRSFAGGPTMNVIHGYPAFTPYPNATWPGYTNFWFDFTDMWNQVQPAWRHMRDVLDYVGRNQWALQQGTPKVDLAFYLYASPWTPVTQYNSTNLQDLAIPGVHRVGSIDEIPGILTDLDIVPRVALNCSANPVTPVYRSGEDTDYVYFFNDQDKDTECKVTISTSKTLPYTLDAWDGSRYPLPNDIASASTLTLPLNLKSNGTLLLALSSHPPPSTSCDKTTASFTHTLTPPLNLTTWNLTIEDWHSAPNRSAVQLSISCHNLSNMPLLWPTLSASLQNVSGVGHYSTIITAPQLLSPKTPVFALLSLPLIQHTARVFLDGERQRAIDPVNPSLVLGPLEAGTEYELCVEVTMTLFNRVKAESYQIRMVGMVPGPKYEGRKYGSYGLVGSVMVSLCKHDREA
ncbi:hypothetical protein E8E11_010888 [Didymella keratinophila]|nr:hypothetical protein E8E11_010888 [Didymella keratinophila]